LSQEVGVQRCISPEFAEDVFSHWDINGESIENMVIFSAIHSDRNSKVKTQV
jgi:hypothetical protein